MPFFDTSLFDRCEIALLIDAFFGGFSYFWIRLETYLVFQEPFGKSDLACVSQAPLLYLSTRFLAEGQESKD